jgi:mono/diheme cytochrome c family protein
MGEWMVSLPARRKRPTTSEHALPPSLPAETDYSDSSAQPYEEVEPGDPDYEGARASAAGRLAAYKAGRRYGYCPSTEDIFDPRVKGDVLVPIDEKVYDPASKKLVLDLDSVPNRPHWVPTDLSEPEVDWSPRRPDWAEVLAPARPADRKLTPSQRKDPVYLSVLDTLDSVRITDAFRKLALTPFRYGVWKSKPECDKQLAGEETLAQLTGAARPAWADRGQTKPPADARVYKSSPGAAVFNAICINCHGPNADSRGLQAETLAEMTGGDARVANLRDGLLGGARSGSRNIDRVYGPLAGLYPKTGAGDKLMVTAEDWAARYVAWMALGGTEKRIPQAILNNVGAGEVLGVRRKMREAGVSTPNMLQAAELLCRNSIPQSPLQELPIEMSSFFRGAFDWSAETSLLDSNGDAEMWIRLCSFGNRPIVRVVRDQNNWDGSTSLTSLVLQSDVYYWADGLPEGATVMNQGGEPFRWDAIARASASFVICAEKPKGTAEAERATKFLADNRVAGKHAMPFCPTALIDAVDGEGVPKWKLKVEDDGDGRKEYVDIRRWAARGAINAGLAVFLYLGEIKAGKPPTPRYDQCQDLPEASSGGTR